MKAGSSRRNGYHLVKGSWQHSLPGRASIPARYTRATGFAAWDSTFAAGGANGPAMACPAVVDSRRDGGHRGSVVETKPTKLIIFPELPLQPFLCNVNSVTEGWRLDVERHIAGIGKIDQSLLPQ